MNDIDTARENTCGGEVVTDADISSKSPQDLLRWLQVEEKATAEAEYRQTLPRGAITLLPKLFQPRQLAEHHLGALQRAIEAGGALEPILVWRAGTRTFLLDGHHRIEAYGRAGFTGEIPVRFFEGDAVAALVEAGKANSRAKLPMDTQERMNFAWRLVTLKELSKRQIHEAASISDGQVGAMRRTLKALEDAGTTPPSGWWQALSMSRGEAWKPLNDEERQTWVEEQAQHYADRLGRTFSNKLVTNTEIAAEALRLHFGRRLEELLGEFREEIYELMDRWEEEKNYDF